MPKTLDEWLALLEHRHHKSIDLGLDRCRAVWQRMGSPVPARQVVVVAGTNGKGSTVATICALLGALGFRYGSYTTPHILAYNERIQVQGGNAPDAGIVDSFERVEAARGATSLSYFEFGTLAAFDYLARQELDFAVMEIGLGGRLDAVNLLDADCAVITPIGLDHQEYLGDDLDSIGREKAGIVRSGRPLVLSEAHPPPSVLAEARRLGAAVRRFGVDFHAEPAGDRMRFQFGGRSLDLPAPVLPGVHQVQNAAAGLAAVLTLLPAALEQIEILGRGLESVVLPGRFQKVRSGPAVWLDVGHNALGARSIAEVLRSLKADGRTGRIRCILAMLADKDAAAVGVVLDPVVDAWYCAGLKGERGQSGAALAERLEPVLASAPHRVCKTVGGALEQALADAGQGDGVLVFGSFFTVADAMHWLQGSNAIVGA